MSRVWHVAYLVAIAVLIGLATRPGPSSGDADFQDRLIEKTDNFENVRWLGIPVWQSVMDLWTLQETIAEVKPALLIECGTYKGGSSYFFAHLFDLMGYGRVITVDIEKLHDLSHPRVTYLIGDCASPAVVERISAESKSVQGPVFVVLDSDHSAAHVAKEMAAYGPLVTPGSYLHVQDGVIDQLPRFAKSRPGPVPAIEAFLLDHPEFEIDHARTERFLISHHPKGWLRRTTAGEAPVVRDRRSAVDSRSR